jgi:outer membrane protein assembly factor BamB
MRDHLLRALTLLALLALAGCTQPTSVPIGGPPTPIVLRTPPPTATPIPPAPAPSPAPLAPLSVYVALGDYSLAALDASSGAVRWRVSLEPITTLALVNNVLYAGTDVGVYALNALDGAIRWHRYQGNAPIVGLAVQNNIVYTTTQGGVIQALNASDGAVRWGVSAGFQLNNMTLDGDRLLVSSLFGTLEAWGLNGDMLWIQQVNDVVFSRVVADNDLLFLAENLPGGNPSLPHLVAFSRDGQLAWDIVPGHEGPLAAPVVTTDGLVYTADSQGVYAIDPLKGAARWQQYTGSIPQSAQHALTAAGNVVMLCLVTFLSGQQFQGQVQAYSMGEGKPYWQAALEKGTTVSSTGCQGFGGMLVVEALGRLYALNTSSGSQLWENRLDDSASPFLTVG